MATRPGKNLNGYEKHSGEGANSGKVAEAIDSKLLEACSSSDSTLILEERQGMCRSTGCENTGDIGKAAEKLAEKLRGFEALLGKLQKDVGDATWQNIRKEYAKYLGDRASYAGSKGA